MVLSVSTRRTPLKSPPKSSPPAKHKTKSPAKPRTKSPTRAKPAAPAKAAATLPAKRTAAAPKPMPKTVMADAVKKVTTTAKTVMSKIQGPSWTVLAPVAVVLLVAVIMGGLNWSAEPEPLTLIEEISGVATGAAVRAKSYIASLGLM